MRGRERALPSRLALAIGGRKHQISSLSSYFPETTEEKQSKKI